MKDPIPTYERCEGCGKPGREVVWYGSRRGGVKPCWICGHGAPERKPQDRTRQWEAQLRERGMEQITLDDVLQSLPDAGSREVGVHSPKLA